MSKVIYRCENKYEIGVFAQSDLEEYFLVTRLTEPIPKNLGTYSTLDAAKQAAARDYAEENLGLKRARGYRPIPPLAWAATSMST